MSKENIKTEEKKTESKAVESTKQLEVKEKPKVEKKVEKTKVKRNKDDNTAIVNVKNLPISTKFSIEITNHLRGKTIEKAKMILDDSIKLKRAIPMKRFNKDTAHKAGMAAGRYPVKACETISKLLDSAKSNAEDKGLSTDGLFISKINANQGTHQMHHGRLRGRMMKRTHISITVKEFEK